MSSGVHSFGQRGRAPRLAGVEDMIEHVPMEDHRKLRQMFDEVVNEPVPDEFLDILRKAETPSGER